jgi:DNA repair protein SbcC/Rad50
MEILSVTLKNFKSHRDRHFVFQPGTNAICGENGAGKTSILEAIAWTLFNYRGAYNKEDLICNGAGSAQATVSFISSRDGRTYEVQRCTTKGYTLHDPQLGVRLDYRHIEDEVMPWMRQQFGVAPGTDLGKLFANTIGVPQGTFTADFLQSSEKRKPIFDAILKVEEYRLTNQQMLSLEKYGKTEVENLERSIAQHNETLQEWEPLQQRQAGVSQAIAQDEAQLQQLQLQLATLQIEKDRLTVQAQQVQQVEAELQKLTTQVEGKQQANQLLEQSVQRAQQSVEICTANRASFQTVRQAEEALKELDQQVKQQQKLLKQREAQQQTLAERQLELAKSAVQLENLAKAAAEIEQLQPLIQQQGELEQQQQQAIDHLQQLQASRLEQQNLTRQLTKVQADLKRLATEISRIEQLEANVDRIADLEQRRDRLQEQLSRIQAAQQFEADLRRLVTAGVEQRDRQQIHTTQSLAVLQQVRQALPMLTDVSIDAAIEAALTAIQSGVDLNTELLTALQQILADLSEQISAPQLQQQLRDAKKQLDIAYQQRAEVAMLETKLVQEGQSREEAAAVQVRLGELQAQLTQEASWQERRSLLTTALTQLSDPRGRSQLLARDLQQQPRWQLAQAQMQQAHTEIQQAIAALEAQLDRFADLDQQIDLLKQIRQTHQAAYLVYLEHQKDANSLNRLETDWKAAVVELQQFLAAQAALHQTYEQLTETYQPDQWRQVEANYNSVRSQADQIVGSLPQQRKLRDELDAQLAALQTVAEKRDRAQVELKQRERLRRFITFARKVYKEAGPRITERYVQSISHEADKLFRELMNRPNVALEWTRDYEILVQEGANPRRFINLSGGEQMCAALAVRLALLRVLADIDIAFFDEPTTNMDRPRRESLAEAIANIKTFRQLFVISHDDTFEKVTENVILVERE